jgi:DNA-binding MarR family transcriptional regulator
MATRALGPVSVTELARKTLMDRTTLTRNLKLLENKGLVKIEQAMDQRKREIRLTEAGQEMLSKAFPAWERAQSHVVQRVGEERIGHLLSDLTEIVSRFSRKPTPGYKEKRGR